MVFIVWETAQQPAGFNLVWKTLICELILKKKLLKKIYIHIIVHLAIKPNSPKSSNLNTILHTP